MKALRCKIFSVGILIPLFLIFIETVGRVGELRGALLSDVFFVCVGIVLTSLFFCFAIKIYCRQKMDRSFAVFATVSLFHVLAVYLFTFGVPLPVFGAKVAMLVLENISLLAVVASLGAVNKLAKYSIVSLNIACGIASSITTTLNFVLGFTMCAVAIAVYAQMCAIREEKKYNSWSLSLLIIYSMCLISSKYLYIESAKSIVVVSFMSGLTVCILIWCCAYVSGIISRYNAETERAKLDLQLKEKETALMLSQIKPHFIYNALNTIQYLVRVEPELAAETIADFSDYLRTNLSIGDGKQLVPFSEELKHIKRYLKIEKLRFKSRLQVKYNIETEDFMVPILSIQPIIENAVKHGISPRLNGGTVEISSYLDDTEFVVTVHDNGVGMARKHIRSKHKSLGLNNVKSRVDTLCGGRVEIDTVKDIGTTVTLTFPLSCAIVETEDEE